MIFSCFTQKLKEKVGGLLGGQRVCWPPLSNYWGGGGGAGPPLPTPMPLEVTRLTWICHWDKFKSNLIFKVTGGFKYVKNSLKIDTF